MAPETGVDTRGGGRRSPFDQPYLLLSLTSLFWAGNTVLARFIVGHVPPMTLGFIRWGGAFLVVLPFAARHLIRDWPVIRKHAGLMTVFALNAVAYYGLQYTTAIHGLLPQSITRLFVALWTFVLFGERLSPRQTGGICISLTGVMIIVCQGSLVVLLSVDFNRGDLSILIALLIYAFYTAWLRKRPTMHPLSFLAAGMGWGAICFCQRWPGRS
jgi:drug/metabolite transporter (DMT)-like permease